MMNFVTAEKYKICMFCGKGIDLINDSLFHTETIYCHTNCLPSDKIALINNLKDLRALIEGLPDEMKVLMLTDKGNKVIPTISMEKDIHNNYIYLEIRK